jgi:hypothetical protein
MTRFALGAVTVTMKTKVATAKCEWVLSDRTVRASLTLRSVECKLPMDQLF